MHQALYRKYRPRTFDDVCGEDHITSVLRYEAREARFSHAYLFCGPRGTGKTSCAKILAKALNCENPSGGNPCGKCFACRSIDSGTAPDVLEMDAASNTGVDYIRDIRDAVSYTPAALKRRVYIIDEVHMLSSGAFNALLKTLEEPPEHVVFILATTEFHKLPATIVSRCQRFDFRRIRFDVIADRLMYISKEENIPLTEDAAAVIAKQAQGGMRDAISLFELCASGGAEVTADHVRDILGLTGIETLYRTAVAVARNNTAAIFKIIETVCSSSKDISVYWSELIGFWRDMLVFRNLGENERGDYFDLTAPEMRLLADSARRFSDETISYHFSLLDEALRDMARLPQTKRLSAELALIKMSDAKLDTSTSSLLARISSLEEKIAMLEAGVVSSHTDAQSASQAAPLAAADDPSEPAADAAAEEPAGGGDNVTDEVKRDDYSPVEDIGEVVERLAEQNPPASSFLSQCDCYVSSDKTRLLIRANGDFAKSMLSTESALRSLGTAFRVCGITDAGAVITVEAGAKPKKKSAIDELAEF